MTTILKTRVLCLALIAVFLFPCISFTDDLILLRNLTFNGSPLDDTIASVPSLTGYTPDSVLGWLLRGLDHLEPAGVYSFVVVFLVCPVLTVVPVQPAAFFARFLTGRSPPSL